VPRLLVLVPCAPDAPRGNAVTAARLARGLRNRGWEVEVAEVGPRRAPEAVDADVVLALHGERGAPFAARLGRPYVVLLTGTDLVAERAGEAGREAARGAAAVVVLAEALAERAREAYALARPPVVIPQALEPLPEGGAWPQGFPSPPEARPLLLAPAGVRPVKGQRLLVAALAPWAQEPDGPELWLVGPVLDEAYAEALDDDLAAVQREAGRSWARRFPAVGPAELRCLLEAATLAVSGSLWEGAAPNALLEAVAAGTPVLASDVPAHHDFPGPDDVAALPEPFATRARTLATDPAARAAALDRQRARLAARPNPEAEAAAWDTLLRPLAAREAPERGSP